MIFPTTFTWQADSISAAITTRAMPFTPVTAVVANFAVPSLILFHNHSPAKRVPIGRLALRTRVGVKQLAKRNGFMIARQLVILAQLVLCQCLYHSDVLDSTNGQMLNIYTVEWILATMAAALFITRFIVFKTSTAPILAVSLAVAVVFLISLYIDHLSPGAATSNNLIHKLYTVMFFVFCQPHAFFAQHHFLTLFLRTGNTNPGGYHLFTPFFAVCAVLVLRFVASRLKRILHIWLRGAHRS